MESFKIQQGYASYCDECGKNVPSQVTNILEVKGVRYTLCPTCFKRFIGELYNSNTETFEELITVLAKKDRSRILSLVNK